METVFTAVNYRRNEHGVCPGGVYRFAFEGESFDSDHIANGPGGLLQQFTCDITRADSNFLAHRGADATFYAGVTLTNGRFACAQAFAARRVTRLSETIE